MEEKLTEWEKSELRKNVVRRQKRQLKDAAEYIASEVAKKADEEAGCYKGTVADIIVPMSYSMPMDMRANTYTEYMLKVIAHTLDKNYNYRMVWWPVFDLDTMKEKRMHEGSAEIIVKDYGVQIAHNYLSSEEYSFIDDDGKQTTVLDGDLL